MRASPQLPFLFAVANGRDRRVSEDFAEEALFRCSQGCTEIAQFVVNLIGFPYGLGDFFAEQIAVSVTQPVYEIFYCRFLKAEYPGKSRVRYIFSLRSETTTQDIKDTPSTALFALIAQSAQGPLDHCRRPAHVENSFWRPIVRFPLWNRQVRWRLGHPIIPGNELEAAATFACRTLVDFVLQETLQGLEQK